MPRREITITWRAFTTHINQERHVTVAVDSDLPDLELCEELFAATNLYEGPLWEVLEPVLPADRTHTALSVVMDRGDHVTVDGARYEVSVIGFVPVDEQSTTERKVIEADQVTAEILAAAEETEEWFADGPIDWEDFWDRLDGCHLKDGTVLNLGNTLDSPAMRKIKQHVLHLRKSG